MKTENQSTSISESQKQQLWFESVLKSAPDIILTLDKNLIITDRYTGREKNLLPYNEVIGKHISEILPEEATFQLLDQLESLESSTDTTTIEYSVFRNGELLYRQALAGKIKDSNDNYIIVIRDQTEKKRMEKLKEDFLRIMRHDLKNPLNAIQGFTNILLMNCTEEQKEILDLIFQESQKMVDMTDFHLRIFRMEEGIYALERNPVLIADITEHALKDVALLREKKNIQITCHACNDISSMKVAGEKLLLENMFSNLLRNAVEASPKNETVTIQSEKTDGLIKIKIHNQNCIPEEIRLRFFEPYTTSGKTTGTGLGTYSAMLIANTHGGNIEFTSSEEEGTTLTVILPA